MSIIRVAIVGSLHWRGRMRAAMEPTPLVVTIEADSTDDLRDAQHPFDVAVVESLELCGDLLTQDVRPVLLAEAQDATTAQLRSLTETHSQSTAAWMIGCTLRYRPDCQVVRNALRDGRLGRPGALRVHHWCSCLTAVNAGTLLDVLDLAMAIFGGPPSDLYTTSPAADSHLHLHLGFGDGGMAMIDIVHSLPQHCRYDMISLIGSDGACYSDDHHNAQVSMRAGGPCAVVTPLGNGLWPAIRELLKLQNTPAARADYLTRLRTLLVIARAVEQSRDQQCAMRWQGDRYESV